jgi:hypothetical protein
MRVCQFRHFGKVLPLRGGPGGPPFRKGLPVIFYRGMAACQTCALPTFVSGRRCSLKNLTTGMCVFGIRALLGSHPKVSVEKQRSAPKGRNGKIGKASS